jgi:polyketide biosynthesis 3-hydroxy-3-methylglutaryl-CoA synthase-like enzyme PksG
VSVGIEAINAYVGRACLSVEQLFRARDLDLRRLANLDMRRKSVNLPCEDAVTNAVNAAIPLIRSLEEADRAKIELVIIGTESGLDFGKSISSYVQDYLGLSRTCRSFEVKHACYGGTAALQTAVAMISTSPVPGARALVIATDAASAAARNTYWEPSQGGGAVAMLIGQDAEILAIDPGASGFHSFEVMDTLRPRPDLEAGDSDLSLLAYLECLQHSYRAYSARVPGADLMTTFAHLAFHTPFAGMVPAAFRRLRQSAAPGDRAEIEQDFAVRVAPGLHFASEVGNICSASLYLSLCSLVAGIDVPVPERVGLFSYGSGCASEFYSGVVTPVGRQRVRAREIEAAISDRYPLSMAEYELLSDMSLDRMCGVRDQKFDTAAYSGVWAATFEGHGLLVLDQIEDFHRRYRWS